MLPVPERTAQGEVTGRPEDVPNRGRQECSRRAGAVR